MLFKRKSPSLAPTCSLEVVGMEYYTADIESIGIPQRGYNMPLAAMAKQSFKDFYKLFFRCSSAQLVPEPTNKADKHAIKVVVDGVRIGYVPASSTNVVRQYLALPHSLSVTIHGGHIRTCVPDPLRIVESFKPYGAEIVIRLQ